MSIKWKNRFRAILLFGTVALILVFNYINDEHTRQLLKSSLSVSIHQYEDGTASEIDFSKITPFSWDRLYIFGPYSGCKSIVESLGTTSFWFDCKFSRIESSEYKSLFVFVDNGEVVQYLVYEKVLANSIYAFKEEGYPIQESHFILDDHSELVWVSDK